MFKGTISLPAGNYMANYVSDDSHLYDNWNAMPPTDPQFAGLTIWPASGKDKANVVPFKKPEEIKPVLQITQVSDNELRSEGMRIKSPVELRILCLGEESDDEMADRGWIVNAATHQVVWDMNDQSTERAGGADKNRMVDGTVRLDKGDYIVYYSTDDSHSFGDWNSGPPHEQDFWGITLWATRKEDVSRIEKFDPAKEKSGNTIAEILHVRNDEFNTEIFVLSKETTVRVVAIGEGDDDEMFDYAWIKDAATDKTVWKMKYENTDHAGGDKKNRRSDETLTLPKGSYKLYYKTDGSHSYRDWNAKPPYDQEQYGVSVEQKSDTK